MKSRKRKRKKKVLKTRSSGVLILLFAGSLFNLYAANVQSDISLSVDERSRIENREIVIRKVKTIETTGTTQEAIGMINASPKSVLETVIDFSKYHKFMPNVKRVEILEQKSSTAILNYYLELPMGIEQKYRVMVFWEKTGLEAYFVGWESMAWLGLDHLETIEATHGFWNIQPGENGQTLLLYHAYVDPGPVPFGFGWIVDFMTESSFPDVFKQTRAYIESP